MKLPIQTAAFVVGTALCTSVSAAPLDQYAASVIDFSSQFSTPNYSAAQAIGAPNVLTYGDNTKAWTASSKDNTVEFIGLRYATPVYAYGATIRESSGGGFVTKVEARGIDNIWRTVWVGTDPSIEGKISDFFVKWPLTTFKVNGLRVHTNTSKTTTWEEIDSVQLSGVTLNTVPAVGVEAVDPVGSETLSSTGLFVISRTFGALTAPLTVQYSISGTASNVIDYNQTTPLTGTVVIPAGLKKVGLFIKPVDDVAKELPETVTITLTALPSYQLLTKSSKATVTINSDD